jgi:hypothetical protein
MRFIKVPHCWMEDDNSVYQTDLRVNPLSIDAYYAGALDFFENGVPMSRETTHVILKSGADYNLLMSIEEFEDIYAKYMKQ